MSPLPRPRSPNPDNRRARSLSQEVAQTQARPLTALWGLGRKEDVPGSQGHAGGGAGGWPGGSPSTPGRGRDDLSDPGATCAAGNLPGPGLAHFPAPTADKSGSPGSGSHRVRSAGARSPLQPPAPPPRRSELSPMARAAAAPRALRLLGAALLLLLLLPAGRRAAGAPVAAELRCQCLQTVQGIHLKNIQNVVVTPSGPHCDHTEVIATLKNGQEVCLNPEAPLVKRLINKMLNQASPN